MTIQEKLDLNKKIRNFNGTNSFVLSLQKQLKNSKYLSKVEVGKKSYKILSDKQYEAVGNLI
jgi:hypothetical protein